MKRFKNSNFLNFHFCWISTIFRNCFELLDTIDWGKQRKRQKRSKEGEKKFFSFQGKSRKPSQILSISFLHVWKYAKHCLNEREHCYKMKTALFLPLEKNNKRKKKRKKKKTLRDETGRQKQMGLPLLLLFLD